MMIARPLRIALVAATFAFLRPAAAQFCTGDCDSSGSVTVDEVVTGVNIALGTRGIDECLNFDSTGDQGVTVDEILQAIGFALDGCASAPSPTPTPPGPIGTPTRTATASRTPTETPPAEPGPLISYFGLASPSNIVLPSIGSDDQDRPIFQPTCQSGFYIVIEGRPNPNTGSAEVGRQTFESDPANASVRPDLQLLANRDLGNGSTIICDHRSGQGSQPPYGGVPGNLLDFNPSSQRVADAMNDIGCRFTARTSGDACTKSTLGNFRFVNLLSSVQFCSELTVDAFWALPLGDTILAVQLRDFLDRIGQRKEIVIRPANNCLPDP